MTAKHFDSIRVDQRKKLCRSSCMRFYIVSQKTSHFWLAITLTHVNGFRFFSAEMLSIK